MGKTKSDIDIEWLKDQCKVRSLREIAKELKISRRAIKSIVIRYRIRCMSKEKRYSYITSKTSNEIDSRWLRQQYINKHRTMRDIADELDVDYACIQRRLKKIGVVTRSPYSYGNQISYPHKAWLVPMLDSLGVKHITSHVLPKMPEQKNFAQPYEIDEYLPDQKVFLELHGKYHEGEKKKFSDARKTQLLKKHYPDHKVVIIWVKDIKSESTINALKSICS